MAHSAARLPLARSSDELLIERLGDELLVFDRVRQKAHCLNGTAALVWERCDGQTPVAEVAAAIEATGAVGGAAMVAAALAQLAEAGLTIDAPRAAAAPRSWSRRKALQKLGLTAGVALALPLVQSIIAPSVAQAQSCVSGSGPCQQDSDCCSSNCGHPVAGQCGP